MWSVRGCAIGGVVSCAAAAVIGPLSSSCDIRPHCRHWARSQFAHLKGERLNRMDKLFALPIAGDAYLLQVQGRHVLVDGGHSSRSLCSALRSPDVNVSRLDIVVCTHADADHAGGLVSLLDTQPISVGELWLPGAWGDSLPALLRDPREVINALISEMEHWTATVRRGLNQDSDDFDAAVHVDIAEERRRMTQDRPGNDARREQSSREPKAGLTWLREHLPDQALGDAAVFDAAREFNRGRRLARHRAARHSFSERWRTFWLGTINTAERIRRIAIQAVRHDVDVRWFDFGEFAKSGMASGGEPGLLVPMNAVELAIPLPPVPAMGYLARLTPVNEECLVFVTDGAYAWPFEFEVIFTGDSPLGTGPGYQNCFLRDYRDKGTILVATAPHHGSESNAIAYAHLQGMAHVAIWLRSGGSSKHPGPTFRKLPEESRICTHCPHRRREPRLAVVHLSKLPWWPVLRTNGHECDC
jgi:hypothetical protein